MDRIFKAHAKLIGLGVFAAILLSPAVLGGTVLMSPPPPVKPNADELYPESRFGSGPARPDIGIGPGYAARQTEDLDNPEEPITFKAGAPSRGPAGMVFEGDESAAEKTGSKHRAIEGPRTVPQEPVTRSDDSTRNTASTDEPAEIPRPIRNLAPEPASRDAQTMARKGVQEVALIAGDLGFFPKTVFVTRDIPVRMFVTGASKNTLCIMMDSFQVRKQVRSQKIEEITFTPSMPGKYRFYCPVNGMEGTMIVKELASNLAE